MITNLEEKLLRKNKELESSLAHMVGQLQTVQSENAQLKERLSEQSERPKWFEFIRVYERSILGSRGGSKDFVIGFGPRNLCRPEPTEEDATRLAENIKEWIWLMMKSGS